MAANKRFERQAWSLVLPGLLGMEFFDHGDSVVGDGANRKKYRKISHASFRRDQHMVYRFIVYLSTFSFYGTCR